MSMDAKKYIPSAERSSRRLVPRPVFQGTKMHRGALRRPTWRAGPFTAPPRRWLASRGGVGAVRINRALQRTERAIVACDDRIARVRGVMYTSAFSEAMQECTAAFHDAERALKQLIDCLEETDDASVIGEISPGSDGDDLRSLKGETATSEDSHHLSEPSPSTLVDRLRRRASRWPGEEHSALRELASAWAAMEERWYDLVVDTSIM